MAEVKKAVILAAGKATRFLPLSKTLPKELWPLVDKPLIHYLLEELRESGIKQVIFVLQPNQDSTPNYLKRDIELEKILEKRKKKEILAEMNNLEELVKFFSISYIRQEKPIGNGDAILAAKSKIGKEPFALLFCDDIIESKTPATAQLLKLFRTSQRPIVALFRVPKDKISAYGVVKVEKIAQRFFKIKGAVEKPSPEQAPSDLAIVGRYILTPEIMEYLERREDMVKDGGEVMLSEAVDDTLKDGKVVYGCEIEGRWLSCGNKMDWIKSNMYLSLRHPVYGEELKKYLKEII